MLEPSPVADANLENLHHHLAGLSWCDRQELKYQPIRKGNWFVMIGRLRRRPQHRGSRRRWRSRRPKNTQVFPRSNQIPVKEKIHL